MILYLYALADRVARLDEVAGVAAEPLLAIEVPGATLLAGWLSAPPAVDRAALEAQDRVIRGLHDRADALLPMRFGTTAESIDAARRAIEIVSRTLPERFALVRGREQMTVRVLRARTASAASAAGASGSTGSTGSVDATGVGTAYLRSRAGTEPPAVIQPLLDALAPLARATTIERAAHDAIVATVYHLIDRSRGAEYRERAERVGNRIPNLALRISGPSPAYAFARE